MNAPLETTAEDVPEGRLMRRHAVVLLGVLALAIGALVWLHASHEPVRPGDGKGEALLGLLVGLGKGLRIAAYTTAIVVGAGAYMLLSTLLVALLRRRSHALFEAHGATLAILLVALGLNSGSNARRETEREQARLAEEARELRECRASRSASVRVTGAWHERDAADEPGFTTWQVSPSIHFARAFCKPTHDMLRVRASAGQLTPSAPVTVQSQEESGSPWRLRTNGKPPEPSDFIVEVHDPDHGWTSLPAGHP